jgi:nitrogen regulatory protein P-II 1
MVVNDALVASLVDTLTTAARTGKIGDGKIFVTAIDDAIRIRNGDHGDAAL